MKSYYYNPTCDDVWCDSGLTCELICTHHYYSYTCYPNCVSSTTSTTTVSSATTTTVAGTTTTTTTPVYGAVYWGKK
uniref:Uncharacterized protein n=1 Tax=Acrobeloides nanus TaxID=290746 RepID=A0A914BYQ4_9BILA